MALESEACASYNIGSALSTAWVDSHDSELGVGALRPKHQDPLSCLPSCCAKVPVAEEVLLAEVIEKLGKPFAAPRIAIGSLDEVTYPGDASLSTPL